MKRSLFLLSALLLCAAMASACKEEKPAQTEDISALFAGTPPREAYPWVWWHWMDGNISKEGIRKDLLWMNEMGIAGLHQFDAGGRNTKTLVSERIPYMSDAWKDAFRYAMSITDSLGMEVAVASSPGWSSTGGPWVPRENAMKKLVWRTVEVPGGKQEIALPEPYSAVGYYQDLVNFKEVEPWYQDIAAVAVRLPEKDQSMTDLGAVVSSSEGKCSVDILTDGSMNTFCPLNPAAGKEDSWVLYSFPQPQAFKAVTTASEILRSQFSGLPAEEHMILECSDNNTDFKEVIRIPDGVVPSKTVDFPETAATYWRIRVLPSNAKTFHLREFVLHPVTKVNHADEKAGFAAQPDFMQFPTPDSPDAIQDVIVLGAPAEDGKILADLPDGRWRVYRFGYSLTGKQNHPAGKDATGLEVDKLDPESWLDHFRKYLDMYKEASGGMVGQRGVQYILTDSYEARQMTWTKNMKEEFAQRNGYDLLRWLPALTGEIIDSSEKTEKFLWDWRNTLGDLCAENYDRINDIVKEYGMRGRYTEAHESGRVLVGDGMDIKMTATVPMSAIWMKPEAQLKMHQADIRESASVAHVFGQNIAAAESFTANGNDERAYIYCPENMKFVADYSLASGLNRFVIHESAHQPCDDKVPGTGLFQYGQWFNRHETWASMGRPWMDYLARSCYLLQQGKFVADILLYYGEDNCITGLYGINLPDIPSGYSFDYINPKGLLQAIRVKDGKLVTETGMSYQVLYLGENSKRMSLKMLKCILSLAEKGATVCGTLPEVPAGMNDDNKTFQKLRDRLHKKMAGENLAKVLRENHIKPDFAVPGDDIKFVHRRLPDMDIYWVRNFADHAVVADMKLRTPGGKYLEIWNPEDGKQYSTDCFIHESGVSTVLDMAPGTALFLVVKYGGTPAPGKPGDPQHSLAVPGPWTVCFQQGRGAPDSVTWETLTDWTASKDEGIRYFSGTADYTTTLQLEKALDGNSILSLGQVHQIARVSVNGTDCGIAWKAPFVVNIPSGTLKEGKNTITVTVANLWINRIIGDQQPGCKQTYTETPKKFYRADSKLLPSGLIGPVTLLY